jgi:phosphoribosylaminoimidazole (AIR) synthetase
MRRVFNMGVGFVVICSPHSANSIVGQLAKENVTAWRIGEVRAGEPGVEIV